ncbi:PucR-like helix-turn-helix protein [Murinocardiopsis flavida]|uniref:PucR-like helix-turn-helix protein n=1 Tax=Murinocardiopsis flavida TaxID=645275 RepID=A0A2P8DTQ2_9ACTN|nr:helix-turn-helix domain-containing protein [Murinocardiopsis flavida]PSL00598.1 PucR-like helix-turn-helix protein [Murinocardiopsis flavida]
MTARPPTLADVCARPAWTGVAALAGAEHLHRPLTEVVVARDLDAVRPAAGALIAVLTPVTGADWRIDAALRRLADAGACGLLVSGRAAPLRATAILADRVGIPLLGTDDDIVALAVGLRELLSAPEMDRARLLVRAHEALSRRGTTPKEVAATVAALLGARVWILSGEGATLAGDPVEVEGFRTAPPMVQRHPHGRGVALFAPVPAHDADHADLWMGVLLDQNDAAWEETARGVAAVATMALRCWRADRRVEIERDARLRATVLGELLRLDGEPSAELRNRAGDLGWRLGGWHLGFHIGVPDGVDVLGSTAELLSALEAEGIQATLVERHDGWSGWVTLGSEPAPDAVGTVVNGVRRTQRRLARLASSHVGIGRAHAGPAGISATLGEAADAARLAANRREVGRFLHIDRLGLAQLLLAWTRTDTFQPAARDLLAPLSGQPGELDRTLAAYLDAESNLTETAAVLGVHRNTVAARIARVEALLGVDLGSADERLALHLACHTVLGDR